MFQSPEKSKQYVLGFGVSSFETDSNLRSIVSAWILKPKPRARRLLLRVLTPVRDDWILLFEFLCSL